MFINRIFIIITHKDVEKYIIIIVIISIIVIIIIIIIIVLPELSSGRD